MYVPAVLAISVNFEREAGTDRAHGRLVDRYLQLAELARRRDAIVRIEAFQNALEHISHAFRHDELYPGFEFSSFKYLVNAPKSRQSLWPVLRCWQ